jgi:hypothetical protein
MREELLKKKLMLKTLESREIMKTNASEEHVSIEEEDFIMGEGGIEYEEEEAESEEGEDSNKQSDELIGDIIAYAKNSSQ